VGQRKALHRCKTGAGAGQGRGVRHVRRCVRQAAASQGLAAAGTCDPRANKQPGQGAQTGAASQPASQAGRQAGRLACRECLEDRGGHVSESGAAVQHRAIPLVKQRLKAGSK
jgi:hypothetical protein